MPQNVLRVLISILTLTSAYATQASSSVSCSAVYQTLSPNAAISKREQKYLHKLPEKEILKYESEFCPRSTKLRDLATPEGDIYLFRSYGTFGGPEDYIKGFKGGDFHGQEGGISWSASPFIGNTWGEGKGYVAIARQKIGGQNLVHHGYQDGKDQYEPYTREWQEMGGWSRYGMSYLLPVQFDVRIGQLTPRLYEIRVPEEVENVIGWIAVEDLNRIAETFANKPFSMKDFLSNVFQSSSFKTVD